MSAVEMSAFGVKRTTQRKPKCLLMTQSGHRNIRIRKTPSKLAIRSGRAHMTTMADPPNRTDSITVDELLGMAYDAYARARLSPDASTKQKLTRVAEGYLKQAKEMRRGRNSSDRFSNT
jgi:hypothetical protein